MTLPLTLAQAAEVAVHSTQASIQSHHLLPPVQGREDRWGAGSAGVTWLVKRQRKAGRGLCPRGTGGHGEWVAGLLLFELGLRLGLQLPGGGARPPPSRPPPPGCPLRVSRPSEFSSISWMRGGMEPGISIFSVITRSAPAREEGQRLAHTPSSPSPASPASSVTSGGRAQWVGQLALPTSASAAH